MVVFHPIFDNIHLKLQTHVNFMVLFHSIWSKYKSSKNRFSRLLLPTCFISEDVCHANVSKITCRYCFQECKTGGHEGLAHLLLLTMLLLGLGTLVITKNIAEIREQGNATGLCNRDSCHVFTAQGIIALLFVHSPFTTELKVAAVTKAGISSWASQLPI